MNIVFFVIILCLFPATARTYHLTAFNEYKHSLRTQAIGSACLLAFNIGLNVFQWIEDSQYIQNDVSQNPAPLMGELYIAITMLQCVCFAVFVLAKRPIDLFEHFNLRPDVQFSIFQYAKLEHTNNRLEMLKNKEKLKTLLQRTDGATISVEELDDDDLLNPDEVLRRQKAGITTSVLVQHFGEGSVLIQDED